ARLTGACVGGLSGTDSVAEVGRYSRVGRRAPQTLQGFHSSLELVVLRLERVQSLLLGLGGDHQDPRHVGGVDSRRRPEGPDVVGAEGGEEVLGHGTVVTELPGVVADEVPAGEGELRQLTYLAVVTSGTRLRRGGIQNSGQERQQFLE